MNDAQELFTTAHRKIGALAERRRTEIGITSLEFASEVSVPIATLTSFEHGFADTPADELRRIEKGVGWESGAVGRTAARVQSGEIHPERIFMEYLDGEEAWL